MYKSKYWLIITFLVILVSLMIVKSAVFADTDVVLKFGYSDSPNSPIGMGINKFAELVGKKSNGRIEVQTFPSNQLGGTLSMVESLKVGTLDMTAVGADILGGFVPEMNVITLPYLYRDWDHLFKVIESDLVGKTLNNLMIDKMGIRILGNVIHGRRHTFTKGISLQNMDQFSKLIIRVPEAPVLLETFRAFGAHPTAVPWEEVYTSLQTGVVNACETPPSLCIDNKFYEVTDTMVKTGHLMLPFHWLISNSVYEDLPQWAKDALNEATSEAEIYARNISIESEEESIKKLKELGMNIYEIDKEQLIKVVKPVWELLLKDSSIGMDTVEEIQSIK